MKITKLNVYQVDLPLKEGRYSWSNGNYVEVFDSTVVEIVTDEGGKGYAECCPLGSAYLPSFARGVRAGLDELAQSILSMSQAAIAAGKRVFYQQLEMGLSAAYDFASQEMACNMMFHDVGEGIDAFTQKRKPHWLHK